MRLAAKVGDKVRMNCPHGGIGTIVSGNPSAIVNGRMDARVGDKVVCDKCGQSRTIDNGAANIISSGSLLAHVNNSATGRCDMHQRCCPHTSTGTIITGSSNTESSD